MFLHVILGTRNHNSRSFLDRGCPAEYGRRLWAVTALARVDLVWTGTVGRADSGVPQQSAAHAVLFSAGSVPDAPLKPARHPRNPRCIRWSPPSRSDAAASFPEPVMVASGPNNPDGLAADATTRRQSWRSRSSSSSPASWPLAACDDAGWHRAVSSLDGLRIPSPYGPTPPRTPPDEPAHAPTHLPSCGPPWRRARRGAIGSVRHPRARPARVLRSAGDGAEPGLEVGHVRAPRRRAGTGEPSGVQGEWDTPSP
jgi:hypothetical protein